ncbi:LPS-assembly protein LptD [Pararhodospirillum photometricum]|uniref:LPS-assembly protein LptD n=1 Tax=Pararhodospirillum photometricum DSM 122 TaxID=1150469 RepID=H6SS54_PARPM|nr:LPS assembly protein LptD [Pararhodospirillum photometricum]CCG07733.1 Organic solvent tolerance protein OstA-like [Pararhodospirillum photometricum DSM 122]
MVAAPVPSASIQAAPPAAPKKPVLPPALAPAKPAPAAPTQTLAVQSDPVPEGETLVDADSLTRDDDLGVVTARGNVVVVSGPKVLRADVVTYNTVDKMVTASGHVSLTERTLPGTPAPAQGPETTFADYMELTGDLRDGFVRGIQILSPSGTRLAALYGERSSQTQKKEFARGVYTACDSCSGEASPLPTLTGRRDGPRQPPPSWQVKAARVTHDEAEQEVVFHDAWIEAFGVPVLYTPYLSQADSTVYRRSGFLAPSTGSSDRLGGELQLPYYLVFDDHSDAKLTLQYTEKQYAILKGDLNRNFSRGALTFNGSFNPYDEDGWTQGYYASKATWHLDPVWRASLESSLTTRPVYLRRIDVSPPNNVDYLTNHLSLEGFGLRSSASVEGFYFQSVTEGVAQSGMTAVPLLADMTLLSDPLWSNGHVETALNSVVLRRPSGTDSERVSVGSRYSVPLRDGLGNEITALAAVRGDFYHVVDQTLDSGHRFDGSVARVVPQGGVIWRHPLIATGAGYSQVIEPKVGVFAALPDNNPDEIPNEDSRVVTLDVGNLFQPSRVPGHDRVEGGEWTAYSLRYAYAGDKGDVLDIEAGQSYRLGTDTDLFRAGSGLDHTLSDVVARIRYTPSAHLSMQYDTQLDHDSLVPQRHVLRLSGGNTLVNGGVNYLYADTTTTLDGDVLKDRQEITGFGATRVARHWVVSGAHTYSFDRNKSVRTALAVGYDDECLSIATTYTRDHTVEYDVKGGTTLMFTLTLKTLGSYSFSPSLGDSSS